MNRENLLERLAQTITNLSDQDLARLESTAEYLSIRPGIPYEDAIESQARAWRAVMKFCQGLGARARPSGQDTVMLFIQELYQASQKKRAPEGEGSRLRAAIVFVLSHKSMIRNDIPFELRRALQDLEEVFKEGEQELGQ